MGITAFPYFRRLGGLAGGLNIVGRAKHEVCALKEEKAAWRMPDRGLS
jgi:hypothetical protein